VVYLKHNKQRTKYTQKSYNLKSKPILSILQNAICVYLATAICPATSNAITISYCQSINDPRCKFVSRTQKRQQLRNKNTIRIVTSKSNQDCDCNQLLPDTQATSIEDFDLFYRLQNRTMSRTATAKK